MKKIKQNGRNIVKIVALWLLKKINYKIEAVNTNFREADAIITEDGELVFIDKYKAARKETQDPASCKTRTLNF